jgi:hypothetical protein
VQDGGRAARTFPTGFPHQESWLPAAEHLAAGAGLDPGQVGGRLGERARPGEIAGQEHEVLLTDAPIPGLGHARGVVVPERAEHVHRLVPRKGEVQIGESEPAHEVFPRAPTSSLSAALPGRSLPFPVR